MTFETDDLARASATDFVGQLAAAADKRLGTRLCGAYLLGSLAHGGFSRRYSDVDMALIVVDGLREQELSQIRTTADESPAWAGRLSVFWSNPDFTIGRFPPL